MSVHLSQQFLDVALSVVFWLLTAAIALDIALVCLILWRRYPEAPIETADIPSTERLIADAYGDDAVPEPPSASFVSLWAEANHR